MKRFITSFFAGLALAFFVIAPLGARMTLVGAGKYPSGGGGGGSLALTYIGGEFDDSDYPTDYTKSYNLGTATATRRVIVGLVTRNVSGNAPASVTAAGTSLTRDAGVVGTQTRHITMWSAIVSSGSGAQDIVVTGGGGGHDVFIIAVWTLEGASSSVKDTSEQTGHTYGGGTASLAIASGEFATIIFGGTGYTSISGGGNDSGTTQTPVENGNDWGIPMDKSSADADWTPAVTGDIFGGWAGVTYGP